MTSATDASANFPCSISLQIPFPTSRLATTALRALSVDPELSPLVRRDLSVPDATPHRLQVDYSATTNRMLRVSVNSFMDSLKLVLEVMEHMDEDVLVARGLKESAVATVASQ
ncbi:transcription factor pcc1 domain-containing protein [Sarocladium implicatum]|nr:transcription factor pcc1 domain-containing protein [Sarocladium implicatum]